MSAHLLPALAPLVERVRTDVTATRSDAGNMIWTREELTEARLRAHLAGERPRGVCPIREGESTTRVALFDLDSHKGETPLDEMIRVSDTLLTLLEMDGYYPERWTSSGGRGVHVCVVWDEDQDAYSVRMALTDVLAAMGMKNGTKGVAAREIEIFPKQDAVGEGGFGNQFILPLFNKSQPIDHPLMGSDLLPREAALEWVWKGSEPVVVRGRPVVLAERREVAVDGPELKKLQSALEAIPAEEQGYDEWCRTVWGVHEATGGSAEGYALALDFSSRYPGFDQDEFDDNVWGHADRRAGKGARVTAASVYAMAREAGWNDVTEDDFEDLTLVAGDDLPLPNFQRDGKCRIEAVVLNVRAALQRIDVCGMEIAYDEFRDEVVYCGRGQPGQWQRFLDQHYFELRCRLETLGFKPINPQMIRDAVHYVASGRAIDTAMIWLGDLAWDGTPRVDGFLGKYFGVADSDYARAVSRYWWTAMAGRVLSPGCQADMAPVLVSPEQGLRKSSAVAAMVPPDTHRVLNFQQAEAERSRLMRGCLSAELAELHGLKTRAREEIRAWMTKRHEDWVPKYKEMAVRVPRRCVFTGTSNSTELFEEFERRWLPVQIGSHIDVEGITRDRDQLWAEARGMWSEGGVAWAEAERLVRGVQVEFRTVDDAWEEEVSLWLRAGEGGCRPVDVGFTLREVLVEALGYSPKTIGQREEKRVATVLKNLGLTSKVVWREGRSVKRWLPTNAQGFADLSDLA